MYRELCWEHTTGKFFFIYFISQTFKNLPSFGLQSVYKYSDFGLIHIQGQKLFQNRKIVGGNLKAI